MKEVGMRIRVEPELREQFVNLCRDNDVPAAQVLRSFMREFVQTNKVKSRFGAAKHLTNVKLDVRKIASKIDL
jgi:hypothetical protein